MEEYEERLAYRPDPALGEADLAEILATPDPGVAVALRGADSVVDLVRNDGLPANRATTGS